MFGKTLTWCHTKYLTSTCGDVLVSSLSLFGANVLGSALGGQGCPRVASVEYRLCIFEIIFRFNSIISFLSFSQWFSCS